MKKVYIIVLLLISQQLLMGQAAPYAIDKNTNKCCGGNDLGMGSSFKVFGAGQIDSVLLYHRNNASNPSATLYVYKGNGPDPDSLLYQQVFNNVPDWHVIPDYMVRLTTPVEVKTDSVYTIYVIGVPLRHETGGSTYADGTLWTSIGEDITGDLDFSVYVGIPTVASITKGSSLSASVVLSNDHRTLSVEGITTAHLKLLNASGKLICETQEKNMALPPLVQGIYLVQVMYDKEIFTSKIYISQ